MGGSIYNVFMLVLCILFDLVPEIIYKRSQIANAFIKKCFEFVPGRWNQTLIIQFLIILLLEETDAISKERYCKSYIIRFFYSNSSKIIFILLTKVIVNYVVIMPINIRKAYLE